jgi:D-glycero-D-manno-heptose 1,7-bisphosphate phosphatase
MGERQVVVLDRDGTLIDVVRDEETGAIVTAFHPDQIRLMPGVLEGLNVLKCAGYRFAIASNQPGPAKGQISAHAVMRTNQALADMLGAKGFAIDKIVVCMHHPSVSECDCRKPKPGMLLEIARDLGVDPARCWHVGDTTTDVLAGRAANMRTALVFDTRRCELCPLRGGPAEKPDVHGPTFLDVARRIAGA